MSARQEDIAQELGLSLSTVSLALRDAPQIAEDTRLLVKEAANRLGYVYRPRSTMSLELAKMELTSIAFIMQYASTNSFYSGILHGAESECRQHHLTLHYSMLEDLSTRHLLQYKDVDALLLVGTIEAEKVQQLAALDRPCILVDNNLPNLGIDRILTENEGSVYRTVMWLHEKGHQHIAFLFGEESDPSLHERHLGYQRAMDKLGLQPFELFCPGNELLSTGERVMQQWLQIHKDLPFTALIGCNDDAAIGACYALQGHGIRIPDDISIIGFDDIQMAHMIRPQLTTNRVHRHVLGVQAVRQLIERARTFDAPTSTTILDTTFVERASTRPLSPERL